VLPEIPPAVRYTLSEAGRGLAPVFTALTDWSSEHVSL
jgi:DNA-binding HxlR family transcriptional regulator